MNKTCKLWLILDSGAKKTKKKEKKEKLPSKKEVGGVSVVEQRTSSTVCSWYWHLST